MPDMELELATRAAPATVVSGLPGARARSFVDILNEPGSGSIELRLADDDVERVLLDRLVRFVYLGVPAWCMLIEQLDRATLDPSRVASMVASGRGHLAVMEEAVVYPARGTDALPPEEDRPFNWTAFDYDDSGWGTADEISAYIANDDLYGYPLRGWPDGGGMHIGPSTYDLAGVPSGFYYYRKDFTLATEGPVGFFWHGDDRVRLFVDGILLGQSENNGLNGAAISADRAASASIYLGVGTHAVAVEVLNYWKEPGFPIDIGPLAGQSVTYADNLTSLILEAYALIGPGLETDSLGDLLVSTDDTWKIEEAPLYPPGMTPGEVIHRLLDEAQARGALVEVSLGFTEAEDSNGTEWPDAPDIVTKVGTDYLVFLREMAASYIDVWMDPAGLTLNAYVKGGRGGATGTVLRPPTDPADPSSGNLLALRHRQVV